MRGYDHGFGIPSVADAMRDIREGDPAIFGGTRRRVDDSPTPKAPPAKKSNNPSTQVKGYVESVSAIAQMGEEFGHFDDQLGEAIRKIFEAMGRKPPEITRGSKGTRNNMSAQRLEHFVNACGDFDECDDELGDAVRGLYVVVDRILMPG